MTITVEPDPLHVGESATVCVQGSSHGGETIKVDVDNGVGGTSSVVIELDDAGNGCATWVVPSWEIANFNYGTCSEVTRVVESP